MADLIKLVVYIEHAQWDEASALIKTHKMDKEKVIEYYNQALSWADEQSQVAS